MYYQFKDGECVASATFEPAAEAGTETRWSDAEYTDIENVRLINGEVVHIEPKEMGDNDGVTVSS